ncbi:uncharacterized protein Bfra_010927 [Botrytis fragariae]|uniref:Uncharacterized protein n=1 Tax=Botrytis fragariae TaxID=1964551 RepID=A0A8H6ALL2_9HELO|nr:uncharacterized protein Bfra_010927 [Botrytis fragariae]KAF5869727.1 hypothetical protein Bfra_010927 [Botrytis fragariae]
MSSTQQTQSESSNSANTDSTGTFRSLPRELHDMIWSQVPADPTGQTGEKQFKMKIKYSGNPNNRSLNARAVILSSNRYMFDHKITKSQLDEHNQHTGAAITKTGAVDSEPACYPTIQNLVFILGKILRELLESVSKVQTLKKTDLLTEEEQMPGSGPVEQTDGRLMDLFAEDDELQSRYGERLRMPEVVCLTMMEFPEELGRRARVCINDLSMLWDTLFLRSSQQPTKLRKWRLQSLSRDEGSNPLDPKFWSLKSTGTNDEFPPQLIEIKKYDVKFEALANGQASDYSNRRPWIINFEVKSIRKSQNFPKSVNFIPCALHLSPSCFKLDYKIKNPMFFRPSCDVLFFREFSHLLEYAVATKGIVTNHTALGLVTNETFPKVERLVVEFEVRKPINWTFHDVLVGLFPVIKEVGTLKGLILLVGRQSLRGGEIGTFRIDEDLKKPVDESPGVYSPPVGVYMPKVTCMTMETFESTFDWYELGQTDG